MQLILLSPKDADYLVTSSAVIFQVLGDELPTQLLAAPVDALCAAVEGADPRVAGCIGLVGG